MINNFASVSAVSNKKEYQRVNNTNFKSEKDLPQNKRKDIYAEMPIRALGYTNELGEAIRPISPMLANLSWLPAIGYISADIADKYRKDEYANQDPSKGRASKQLVTQLLASVFLPTFAVKIGQSLTNSGAALGKTGLTLNSREKISGVVLNSMKSGEHKKFLDETGKVDKEAYKKALASKFDEILKHRRTHKSLLAPFRAAINFVSKPLIKKPTSEKIKNYAGTVADRLIDERQQLLDGIVPDNLSKKAYNKFMRVTKDAPMEEKQSIAFDLVRKMEKGRMFNNRVLKSIGGLAALSLMAKPIDRFVENYVIHRFVGPQIDNVSAMYYKQQASRKKQS